MLHPSLETTATYFSDNYQTARQAWLSKATSLKQTFVATGRASVNQGCIPHPLLGPNQETLASDWLWLGQTNANKVAVILSATHGIEGYAGNAAQLFLLDCLVSLDKSIGENTALLFVHALNPWGMAWKRRCDENGVDLNRNYIDFNYPPSNSGYKQIQEAYTIKNLEQRRRALQSTAATMGQKDFEVALSGGQYVDAAGPFYGGQAPAHGQQVCRSLVEDLQLQNRELIVIDIHTGLGAWSLGELISDHPLGNSNDRYAQRVFGPSVTNPARGDSSSVAKFGLQDYFWQQLMGDQGCYLTLEFGSYSIDALFEVILNDHLIWRNPNATETIQLQQQAMMNHFCPSDNYWQQLILVQAAQTLQRLLNEFES